MALFAAAVGNPPYNARQCDTNNFMPSIYHLVISSALRHAKTGAFIFPARGFYGGGSADVSAWARGELEEGRFTLVSLYRDSSPIFGFQISGGVCVCRWSDDAIQPSGFADFVPRELRGALSYRGEAFSDHFLLCLSFAGKRRVAIESNAFDKLPDIFRDTSSAGASGEIKVLGRQGGKRVWKWADAGLFDKSGLEERQSWRVAIGQASSYKKGARLSHPQLLAPGECVTNTFREAGPFATREEAENCLKYLATPFLLDRLGILKVTQSASPHAWRFVPWPDFSPSSDIDWLQGVEEINGELEKKYPPASA